MIRLLRVKYSIALSLCVGALFSAQLTEKGREILNHAYDTLNPIADMQGVITAQDDDSVTLRIKGYKGTRDCTFKRVLAYTVKDGDRRDAFVARLDKQVDGSTKPGGFNYDIGSWRVWPIDGGDMVQIYAVHTCGTGTNARNVSTLIAEAVL